jgi:hypothetical protein
MSFGERECVKERETNNNKKKDACVNSATPPQMHNKCILHLIYIIRWRDFLVNRLAILA